MIPTAITSLGNKRNAFIISSEMGEFAINVRSIVGKMLRLCEELTTYGKYSAICVVAEEGVGVYSGRTWRIWVDDRAPEGIDLKHPDQVNSRAGQGVDMRHTA